MASSRIPNVGTRVNLQMFAGDLLNHQAWHWPISVPSQRPNLTLSQQKRPVPKPLFLTTEAPGSNPGGLLHVLVSSASC